MIYVILYSINYCHSWEKIIKTSQKEEKGKNKTGINIKSFVLGMG